MAQAEPRIPPLPVDRAVAVTRDIRIHENFGHLCAHRVLLHHPALAKAATRLLTMLLYKGKFDARLRELVIMRLGWATDSNYEWTQHWRVATELGIPAEDILAVRDWRNSSRLSAADKAVLQATDETLATGAISRATFDHCLAHVGGMEEMLELIASIGNWRLFSQFLRTARVPLEDGVASWPPDGVAPPSNPTFRSKGGEAGTEGVSDTPRVPLISKEEAVRLAGEFGLESGQAQRAPYRVLLNNPTLALAANGLLKQLLFDGLLDARVREFIIMRTAWQTASAVEWARHWPFCQRVGISPEEVVAVRDWRSATCFSDAERAALAAVDESLATGTVTDAT